MDPSCLICGDTTGPFEKNHLGAKRLWPDVWFWFCIPCHRVFTSHQQSLGIIKPGPKGGTWVHPRSDDGRRWALFEGGLVALLMAVESCDRCREELSPLLVTMAQTAGVAVNIFEPDAEHPPRTDPVGAARRGEASSPPGEAHEMRLVMMLFDVSIALETGLNDLADITGLEDAASETDGIPWLAEFGDPMMSLLLRLLAAEDPEAAERALAEAVPLRDAMIDRLQGLLAHM